MNYKELIERLRDTNKHTFALWFDAADAIESLLAENERFKYERDLAVQKMKDGWVRICNSGIQYYVVENAKLQAELAKYRDAPCVAYATTNEEDDLTMLFFDEDEARKYSGDDEPIKLIVKPGE